MLLRASSYSTPGKYCVLFLSAVWTTTALVTLWAAAESSLDRGNRDNSSPAKNLKINLDQAIDVRLPAITHDLEPADFRTSDGKDAWVIRIPGAHPIATPAYADGLLFVGGGYGSREFYAFNAKTGEVAWKISTSDDGPTAAVVDAGYVAFNTESCTVIVVDEKSGKVVWQEWLGDPLMSQPAISSGKLFIAYPAGQRSPKHHNTGSPLKPVHQGNVLLAVDLKTGKHLWEEEIPTDVISAPVVSGDRVYITCFDGTSLAFEASSGHVVWKKKGAAPSAPIAVDNHVILTRKQQNGERLYEGLARIDAQKGEDEDKDLLAKGNADYLAKEQGGGVAIAAEAQKSLDSSVGFASPPAAAKLSAANENVGVQSIVGGWAYQGSRAAHSKGAVFNAQGQSLNSVSAKDGRPQWKAEVKGSKVNANRQVFSPPALGRDYIYLSSSQGHLLSVRQKDGELGFAYSFKKPMIFQPALVDGNVYVGTGDGLLICLKTNGKDADGWYEWGGNPQHNKRSADRGSSCPL